MQKSDSVLVTFLFPPNTLKYVKRPNNYSDDRDFHDSTKLWGALDPDFLVKSDQPWMKTSLATSMILFYPT